MLVVYCSRGLYRFLVYRGVYIEWIENEYRENNIVFNIEKYGDDIGMLM